MLSILERIEKDVLPGLLADPTLWMSVFVDYHPPFVERLWTAVSVDDLPYRIYLHRILPAELSTCLFHPHPWPSAMRILSGQYKMITGYGPGNVAPPASEPVSMTAGSSYEMVDPDDWHAVSPQGAPAYSLMVTGEPWGRESPKSTKSLDPLDPKIGADILAFFQREYPR
jgi:hypothetical protein